VRRPRPDAVVEVEAAIELGVHASEDLHQRGLARAVPAQDADLGAQLPGA